MSYHQDLRSYRIAKHVSQAELAREVGQGSAAYIHRREMPPEHPEHVPLSPRRYAELIAGIEAIVERRAALKPTDVLRP